MTDNAPVPAPLSPGMLARLIGYAKSEHILARAAILTALTIVLMVPLNLVHGVVEDRQKFEKEAEKSVKSSWGGSQIFAGPMFVVPYRPVDRMPREMTLLPERLSIDSRIEPQQRRRGLFAVTVYTAVLDVTADFSTKALHDMVRDGRSVDWRSARFDLGLSDPRAIDALSLNVDGQSVEWIPGTHTGLTSLRAPVGGLDLQGRETFTVRFRIGIAGSNSLAFTPLGRRTTATVTTAWPSPSFTGAHLPQSQAIDKGGFEAKWSVSSLGRRYGQLWDSGTTNNDPSVPTVLDSSFGVTLLTPVDAYRETDRTMKYAIMFIGLTFAACMLFELATGRQPHVAQYGLIGLSLCIFYLLLLSFAEQIGFLPAYIASAAAIVVQATVYIWAVQRSRAAGLAFGTILTGLYAGLYGLLQLEDAALLAGSVMLFAVLSLAMWFTRNLRQPA